MQRSCKKAKFMMLKLSLPHKLVIRPFFSYMFWPLCISREESVTTVGISTVQARIHEFRCSRIIHIGIGDSKGLSVSS